MWQQEFIWFFAIFHQKAPGDPGIYAWGGRPPRIPKKQSHRLRGAHGVSGGEFVWLLQPETSS